MFPMVEDDQVMWFQPSPRGTLPLDDRFHVSRSLARTIRQGRFKCSLDACFDNVVRLCSDRGDEEETWISPEIRIAYGQLHMLGFAHSVETWVEGELVGGLYGMAIGRMFYGESMFSRVRDGSKIALVHVARYLESQGVELIDCQMNTAHLASMGGREIARSEFCRVLSQSVLSAHPRRWRPDEIPHYFRD